MKTDQQAKRLRQLLASGLTLTDSALRSGMSEKTARRYRDMNKLPSESKKPRQHRTRKDPLDGIWGRIETQLIENPELQSTTILAWLISEYPGQFDQTHLRTVQRRVRQWRALAGPAKEVFFKQVHHPGDLAASDFTDMSSMDVTIAGQQLGHMVYHFVLTFSNWEAITVCYSESFESLSEGLQNALHRLGGAPARHRTDRLSAAVNNQCDRREFTDRYQRLMTHYGIAIEKTQAASPHENGDAESSHRHFKEAVNQSLILRGSRSFVSLAEYKQFLQQVVDDRNTSRATRVAEEIAMLRPLPSIRIEDHRIERVRVNSGSLVRIVRNTYSVHSRLIGEIIEARVFTEHIEIWYAQRCVDCFPRLRGRDKTLINYRHIIDWLVRKPGAFANYQHRESLFPTLRFRMAYDSLCGHHSVSSAAKQYLLVLQLAALESEEIVDASLQALLDSDSAWTFDDVASLVYASANKVTAPTDVMIEQVELADFDKLLDSAEALSVNETLVPCGGIGEPCDLVIGPCSMVVYDSVLAQR